jgi:transposase
MTVRALRSTAQRIQLLATEAAELRAELERLVAASAPWLLELPGVGPISAAQVLAIWSHPGPTYDRASQVARRCRHPRRRCSPEVGGQEHQRYSAVLEAGDRSAAVQAPGKL